MGKLIVFEGIDGSGKSTQLNLMCDRLSTEGKDFRLLRFPRYDEPSSALVRMYLGGEFGDDPDAVNAYAASSFFAVDRIASYIQDWRGYYENGGLVMTDRYSTSNAIHQGAKLPPEDRRNYFKWLCEFEFDQMGLPAPDSVVYMDISAKRALRRLERRQAETGTAGDIHENDITYLEECVRCGAQAADHYGWNKISCFSGDNERSADELHGEIYSMIMSSGLWD